jgi:ParB-like chromosome segregation protein Spo0J
MANLETIPAMIEEIDDDTALEIAIIENLQREDLSPLDEAIMYDRMTSEHGYSVRKLAQKLGKDKGYIENRLRLADAPPEIRELVSLRKDTVSHAYELLKVEDPRKRRRLAEQVASGELSLVRLREKIEGRRSQGPAEGIDATVDEKPSRGRRAAATDAVEATAAWTGVRPTEISEDSLISAKGHLAEALDELVMVLRSPEALDAFGEVDRGNLAKYLTISKLKLENAIALVRSGTADREG